MASAPAFNSATTLQSSNLPRGTSIPAMRLSSRSSTACARKRNEAFYDIAVIGDEEAEDAVAAVEKYIQVITADIQKRFP